jgi:hypothetical protein
MGVVFLGADWLGAGRRQTSNCCQHVWIPAVVQAAMAEPVQSCCGRGRLAGHAAAATNPKRGTGGMCTLSARGVALTGLGTGWTHVADQPRA